MIYVTGDIHGNIVRLEEYNFPEQKNMTKQDTVIILGDFGLIWHNNKNTFERKVADFQLKKLDEKNFTTVFIDGNHENFQRLYTEFPTTEFHGARAHKIAPSIFHILRGECFTLENKTFFAFGGGKSHDVKDGILDVNDFKNKASFTKKKNKMIREHKIFRIKNETWWEEEMPNAAEMQHGMAVLNNCQPVDYILTHAAPAFVEQLLYNTDETDTCTEYLQYIYNNNQFGQWLCGHYHIDRQITSKLQILYQNIIKIN